MSIDEIISTVQEYSCNLVEITGGEPLLQENTPSLARKLLTLGYNVLVETNGSRDINIITSRCHRIVDIKCPSSSMVEYNDMDNIYRLTPRDEVKFVIADKKDYLYAVELVKLIKKKMGSEFPVLFSPVTPGLKPSRLAKWILEDNLEVRLQLQLHKIIWGLDAEGV